MTAQIPYVLFHSEAAAGRNRGTHDRPGSWVLGVGYWVHIWYWVLVLGTGQNPYVLFGSEAAVGCNRGTHDRPGSSVLGIGYIFGIGYWYWVLGIGSCLALPCLAWHGLASLWVGGAWPLRTK